MTSDEFNFDDKDFGKYDKDFGKNYIIVNSVKSLKIIDDNDFSGISYVLREASNPIDVKSIINKYDRVSRKITLSQFLSYHIMSALIRLAIKTLREIEGDFVLIKQDNLSANPFIQDKMFWTDDKAFIWFLESPVKWTFQLSCQIRVGLPFGASDDQ